MVWKFGENVGQVGKNCIRMHREARTELGVGRRKFIQYRVSERRFQNQKPDKNGCRRLCNLVCSQEINTSTHTRVEDGCKTYKLIIKRMYGRFTVAP